MVVFLPSPKIEIRHMVEKFLSRKKLSHLSIVTRTIGKFSATLKTVAAFTLKVKLKQKETSTISLPNGEQVNIPSRGFWQKLCKISGN